MSSGVIVGYDGSQHAKEAMRVAIEVGRAYGEKVVIAFAYELNPVAGEIHDYHAALRELAQERLTEALSVAADEHEEVEAVVVEHEPAHGLVELADERDARVIVVGTCGESPIKGALLGSTPHKLLQLSRRPVLVVPLASG
jgi:nucleotide-binding universal stress UspA family protein